MKRLPLIFTFMLHSFMIGQIGYEGNYEKRYDMNDGSVFEYKLALYVDGTFLFHAYEKHTRALSPEKNSYGKGTWTAKKKLISFYSNEQNDLDDIHTLDFSNTRARIDRKSLRNTSLEITNETMRIYDSDIPWIKGLKFTKLGKQG